VRVERLDRLRGRDAERAGDLVDRDELQKYAQAQPNVRRQIRVGQVLEQPGGGLVVVQRVGQRDSW